MQKAACFCCVLHINIKFEKANAITLILKFIRPTILLKVVTVECGLSAMIAIVKSCADLMSLYSNVVTIDTIYCKKRPVGMLTTSDLDTSTLKKRHVLRSWK